MSGHLARIRSKWDVSDMSGTSLAGNSSRIRSMVNDDWRLCPVLKEHKDGPLDGQLAGINMLHPAAFKVLLQEQIAMSWEKKSNP